MDKDQKHGEQSREQSSQKESPDAGIPPLESEPPQVEDEKDSPTPPHGDKLPKR